MFCFLQKLKRLNISELRSIHPNELLKIIPTLTQMVSLNLSSTETSDDVSSLASNYANLFI